MYMCHSLGIQLVIEPLEVAAEATLPSTKVHTLLVLSIMLNRLDDLGHIEAQLI